MFIALEFCGAYRFVLGIHFCRCIERWEPEREGARVGKCGSLSVRFLFCEMGHTAVATSEKIRFPPDEKLIGLVQRPHKMINTVITLPPSTNKFWSGATNFALHCIWAVDRINFSFMNSPLCCCRAALRQRIGRNDVWAAHCFVDSEREDCFRISTSQTNAKQETLTTHTHSAGRKS